MVQTRTPDVGAPAAPAIRFGWLLPLLSVVWLLVKLWASRGQIRTSEGGTVTLAIAADALPGVVQATIVAGAGLSLVADAFRGRTLIRWLIRLGAGLVVGLVTAALVTLAYPHLPSITSIGVTLVIAGLLGSALTGIPRIGSGIAGGIAAVLVALVITTFLNSKVVLTHMLSWFGAGSNAQSFVHASKLVQYADYATIGIVAGITAFSYLRRADVKWFPAYLVGGALPGVLMLVGFGLTAVGGARLLDAADALSDADRILNHLESAENVPNAMIVLFLGAFVALIAFGRTLKPASAVPASAKPATVKPAAVKPAAVKPAAVKPAAVKPAAVMPTADAKPVLAKPAPRSAAKQRAGQQQADQQ
jgi:hypothetical protein